MTLETIITQSFALICNTYCAFTKNKKNIYLVTLLFNTFCLLTGFFQGNYGLVASYIIIIYRSIALLKKDLLKTKFKLFPVTFILAHIIFGIVTWNSSWDIIPIITPIITGCIFWFSDNLQTYRFGNILNSGLWLVHNLWSQSYILCIVRVYTIITNIVALIKNKKKS